MQNKQNYVVYNIYLRENLKQILSYLFPLHLLTEERREKKKEEKTLCYSNYNASREDNINRVARYIIFIYEKILKELKA